MDKALKKIICIDDENDILELTKMCLESVGGFEVNACHGGAEGIEAARVFMPDLITVDMMMPEMDGQGTLAALRADPSLAHIPVVFMTARVQQNEVEEYKAAGAAGVIAKPFDPMEISNEIQKIWDGLPG